MLRLGINVVTCDKQDLISTLHTTFEGEIVLTQYCIENKRIDAYFSKQKLEYNHEGRNSNYEKNRQLIIESYGIAIIRTNPDAANFDMNRLIYQIYKHISQSNKEKLKKEKDKIKELEDEIKKLRLQLTKLNVQNNDDNVNDNDKK